MKVFSVSQLNKLIKDIIDNEIVLEDIAVTGELSSFSITRGIAYFTLKDNDNILSCIQFGAKREFQVGDMVECRGNVKYYPKGGKISFNALSIEPCGQGELYKQFLLMKDKLEKEGLFDELNKIPIPKYINSIGVVTSATGAVLQDIRNVTSRRNPNLDIYVYDAQVQGKFAVNDIIQGITYFDNMSDVDVIIVARGGGSLEDLMPFNDEELARVAYICNKPLISAVGHETDFSILDFVADLRAPTPSAAAELVTLDNEELKRYIKDIQFNIENFVFSNFEALENKTELLVSNIERNVSGIINDETVYLNDLLNSFDKLIDMQIENTRYMVNLHLNTLDKLNPSKLLLNGYSVVTKDNQNVASLDLSVGDEVDITTNKQNLKAKIISEEKR